MQIVNAKGEMKGSAITGPVGKEAAELWPVRSIPTRKLRNPHISNLHMLIIVLQQRIASNSGVVM